MRPPVGAPFACENGFDALQVGDVEPARLVIRFKALDTLQANTLNQPNAVLDGIAAQLTIAPGAG